MKKRKVGKSEALIYIIHPLLIIGLMVLSSSINAFIPFFFMLFYIFMDISIGNMDKEKATILLLVPVAFTVTQNIYLGIAINNISSLGLQIMLSLGVFQIFVLMLVQSIKNVRQLTNLQIYIMILILTIHGALLYFIYPTSIIAFISCYRNIVSCLAIYLCTKLYANKIEENRFWKTIYIIALFVVIFGIVEWSIGNVFWIKLNIGELWNKKGIGINRWGVPSNWYSSEKIRGVRVRRMVSSFADPVNLGTFLFSLFIAMWYRKRYILMCLVVVCCIFTVSKGAFLGFLIFSCFYVFYNKKLRSITPFIVLLMMMIGIGFVIYSKNNSTGSMIYHIRGFLNSISLLEQNPLGLGMGNVGVLAFLFGDVDSSVANASETGIGMIITQLGCVGLIVYVSYFALLCWNAFRISDIKIREKVVLFSLIFTFILNAMFNEVALSPNSCILYFMMIGLIEERCVRYRCRNYIKME